jgi:hypothetical protein
MKELVSIILILSISIGANCQDDSGVKLTVTLSGKDTVAIKRFDENQNLVFHKIFPQYGISQVLGWTYSNKVLQSYTWSHSNVGFVESEYQHDSLNDIVNVYSYELKGHSAPKDLMTFHAVNGLKNSEEFKTYVNDGRRFLDTKQFYQNDLLLKELKYESSTRVDTIIYTYANELLTNRKHVYGHNSSYNEIIYQYDSSGNEISWMKVFDSSDTSVVYTKIYDDGMLLEVIAFERGELASKETYKYSKGKLKSIKKTDAKGIEKMSSEYIYKKDGKIDYIDEINRHMGQVKRTYYFY